MQETHKLRLQDVIQAINDLFVGEITEGDAVTYGDGVLKAVHTGKQPWEPVAQELGSKMTWSGIPKTRAYPRTIHALGNALLETGAEDEAWVCYTRLLGICMAFARMNPNDIRGIRYVFKELVADVAPQGLGHRLRTYRTGDRGWKE